LLYLIEFYEKNQNILQREIIARSLSHHVDYLLLKLKDEKSQVIRDIINYILKLHLVEDLIDFVNQNKDPLIEKEVMEILKVHMTKDSFLLNALTPLRLDWLPQPRSES
jgi:hypothetical protein